MDLKQIIKANQEHVKKIIILPSSFYECQELIDCLDERFVIFCREKQSYRYMKRKAYINS